MSYYKQFFNKINLNKTNTSKIICIDGVVGVGKSSLAEILADKYGYKLYEEPVINNPILDKFYYDKKRWSFPLQIFFLNKRFQSIKEAEAYQNCIMDRSIYGDIIFSRMLAEDGDLTMEEFEIYEELLGNMLEHLKTPKLTIYLESNVENAISKIKKRGREYEKIVEYSYWEHLNKHYKEYFDSYNISDVLVINVDDIDFVNNLEDRAKVLDIIDNKLNETK